MKNLQTKLMQDRLTDLDRRMLRVHRGWPCVEMTPEQVTEAFAVGGARQEIAERNGTRNFKKDDTRSDAELHHMGAVGELAYSLWSGVPWLDRVMSQPDKRADFEDGTDVKTCTNKREPYLIVPKRRNMKLPRWRFVQIKIADDFHSAHIVGWVSAARFKAKRREYRPRGGRTGWIIGYSDLNPMEHPAT